MFEKLIMLYKCDENAKYSLSELSKILNIDLPQLSKLSNTLIKRKIIRDGGEKIVFSVINGKTVEVKVKSFLVDTIQLDKYLLNDLEPGKILFDRSHIYINRYDLLATAKIESLE